MRWTSKRCRIVSVATICPVLQTDYETLPSCWICGSDRTFLWKHNNLNRSLQPDDFRITDHRYGTTLSLLRCSDCNFLFAPPDEIESIVANYEQLEDPDYEKGRETRALQMRRLLEDALNRHPDAKTMLDIGSGIGLMVREAIDMGLDAEGVEPSYDLVERAEAVNKVKLHRGIFPHPDLQGRDFDIILLVDVIEHVSDPTQLLRDCRNALAADGLLVVVTPDLESIAARLLGPRWWHFRLAHVGYFTRKTLNDAAKRAGLAIDAWLRPSWFFPVRYLAHRVGEYLPIRPLNKLADALPPTRWMYDQVIQLNLCDSITVYLKKTDS